MTSGDRDPASGPRGRSGVPDLPALPAKYQAADAVAGGRVLPSLHRAQPDRGHTVRVDAARRDGSTSEMIYDCFQQVAHLPEAFTLEPGDVIATGTPAGIGAVRQPFPEGLRTVGEAVRVEIDRIGSLTNTTVEEPDGFVVDQVEAEPAWAL
jgi:2-keto-4-pentenoate hydratase/2-oxohepta-3-ene-1,7-dioic acid hydratase in catechol pathway